MLGSPMSKYLSLFCKKCRNQLLSTNRSFKSYINFLHVPLFSIVSFTPFLFLCLVKSSSSFSFFLIMGQLHICLPALFPSPCYVHTKLYNYPSLLPFISASFHHLLFCYFKTCIFFFLICSCPIFLDTFCYTDNLLE